MPTLEERTEEGLEELQQRLKQRQEELNINKNFSEYIEMMEKYLLRLERRVNKLEGIHGIKY